MNHTDVNNSQEDQRVQILNAFLIQLGLEEYQTVHHAHELCKYFQVKKISIQ
jgi:hypothetical protein